MPTIALTPGEPAGIGPDLAVRLIQSRLSEHPAFHLVLIADPELLFQRARKLGITVDLPAWSPDTNAPISILPVHTATTVTPGVLDKSNSAYVIDTLRQSINGCKMVPLMPLLPVLCTKASSTKPVFLLPAIPNFSLGYAA